jgi:ParB family transcriptional regulator, chromosome partitioning protein
MSARGAGRQRLGKGLGALLGETLGHAEGGQGELRRIRTQSIRPNPFQPRREFAEEELSELRESIRTSGLLQPPVVRPAPGENGGRYELVAGERRFRCVKELGWEELPVLVREVDDRTLLVLALVENIQREELSVLEEAEGYRVLSEDFGLTQAEIAESVGKRRSTVANALRLLRLPVSVRRHLEAGELTMGHARAILAVGDGVAQAEVARRAVEGGWSVRETERRIRKRVEGDGNRGAGTAEAKGPNLSPPLRILQEEIRRALGTRAAIRPGKDAEGRIEIPYRSDDDLERIFHLLTGLEATDVVS